jgi:hypothetical protein
LTERPLIKQVSLQPGEVRLVDDYYDANGQPVSLRLTVADCPPVSGTEPPVTQTPAKTAGNDPPVRANLVQMLHEAFAEPHEGWLQVTGRGGAITIEPETRITIPDYLRGVTPRYLMQSATLHPGAGPSNRFQVTLDSQVEVEPSTKALVVLFPDAPH